MFCCMQFFYYTLIALNVVGMNYLLMNTIVCPFSLKKVQLNSADGNVSYDNSDNKFLYIDMVVSSLEDCAYFLKYGKRKLLLKYHEIEAYGLDCGLLVFSDLCDKTVHCLNGRPFDIYWCVEHVYLVHHKHARLHKNYRDQQFMYQK